MVILCQSLSGRDWGPVAESGGRVRKLGKSGISCGKSHVDVIAYRTEIGVLLLKVGVEYLSWVNLVSHVVRAVLIEVYMLL